MTSLTTKLCDYLELNTGKTFTAQQLAKHFEASILTIRSILTRTTTDDRYQVYRVGKNCYSHSRTHVDVPLSLNGRILEWWENHKGEEVTPFQVSNELKVCRHGVANQMKYLSEDLSCIHRIRRGVYIWDEEQDHEFQSQVDIIIDYIKEHGGRVTQAQMERDLGISHGSLCVALSKVQSHDKVKIRRVRYVELVRDNRK